jgi:hypothetical protein
MGLDNFANADMTRLCVVVLALIVKSVCGSMLLILFGARNGLSVFAYGSEIIKRL